MVEAAGNEPASLDASQSVLDVLRINLLAMALNRARERVYTPCVYVCYILTIAFVLGVFKAGAAQQIGVDSFANAARAQRLSASARLVLDR